MRHTVCTPCPELELKGSTSSFKSVHVRRQTCKTTGHHTVTQSRGKFEPYLCLGSLQDKTRIYTARDMVRKPEKHACWTKKTSNSTLISPPDLLLSSYDWKTDHVMQKYLKHYLRNAVWRQ